MFAHQRLEQRCAKLEGAQWDGLDLDQGCERSAKVRFGSKADIRTAKSHVRFTSNNDRESGFPQNGMSALPRKADMCGAQAHVCFGPIADIS